MPNMHYTADQSNRQERRHPERNEGQERLLNTVNQACEILSLSRATIYRLLESGDLQSYRVGRRRMIPTDAIRSFLADLAASEGAS